MDKRALQELVKEVDPSEQLDEDVEDMLLQIADDFIENIINSSCQLAKHRKSNILEAKDVQFHLERNYNLWIPGFGTDELKPYKKNMSTEAHKQVRKFAKNLTYCNCWLVSKTFNLLQRKSNRDYNLLKNRQLNREMPNRAITSLFFFLHTYSSYKIPYTTAYKISICK